MAIMAMISSGGTWCASKAGILWPWHFDGQGQGHSEVVPCRAGAEAEAGANLREAALNSPTTAMATTTVGRMMTVGRSVEDLQQRESAPADGNANDSWNGSTIEGSSCCIA